MKYVVSIQDYAFEGEWLDLAAFRWHADALDFAQLVSRRDRHKRDVRIEGSTHYADVVFRDGVELAA